MERTCARAVELGLPAVAFTEHADYTLFTTSAATAAGADENCLSLLSPDGTPPELYRKRSAGRDHLRQRRPRPGRPRHPYEFWSRSH